MLFGSDSYFQPFLSANNMYSVNVSLLVCLCVFIDQRG